MKRAKAQKPKEDINTFKKANAILTGDWHLREDTPVARTDNYYDMQWNKLDFISELQENHDCPIFHSGDLFNHWKPSPMLLGKIMEHIPNNFWTIYGNHDLPQHNIDLFYKSGIYTLYMARFVHLLADQETDFIGLTPFNDECFTEACNWLESPIGTVDEFFKDLLRETGKKVLVWHTMTYQGKKPWPDCTDPKGSKLLRKYPEYDLILTGHNHKPFVETHQGRLLVNPGSIFRMSADQQDHTPRVYLWYADTNTVTPVYLPIEKNVVSRMHIEKKEERDNRIDAFISGLDTNWEAKMSFGDNIEEFRKVNKVRQSVMDIVYKAIE